MRVAGVDRWAALEMAVAETVMHNWRRQRRTLGAHTIRIEVEPDDTSQAGR